MLMPGDPAPWFMTRSTANPEFHFDTVGGRYLVLCFFGSAADPGGRRVLDDIERNHDRFDGENVLFFGVSTDPGDERLGRVRQQWPTVLFFWDFDLAVSRLYSAASADGSAYQQHTVVLDWAFRTLAVVRFSTGIETHVPKLLRFLDSLPRIKTLNLFAPVLVVPNVFEPEFCRTLIGLYEQHGGQESGFMRDIDGKTVAVYDQSHKRRQDYHITDRNIIQAAQVWLHRRLVPEIRKAFQFNATYIERYIVACYDASTGGHFRPHRDDTTEGTAHRRFAVTMNLNADEYEGGDLRFPEFGRRAYRASTGGAVVFSCSLLHEAMPVTKGKRYAFLPFLYDADAAQIQQMNRQFLAGNTRQSPP